MERRIGLFSHIVGAEQDEECHEDEGGCQYHQLVALGALQCQTRWIVCALLLQHNVIIYVFKDHIGSFQAGYIVTNIYETILPHHFKISLSYRRNFSKA